MSRNQNGFIVLQRRIVDHWVFADEIAFRLWVLLLAWANWKPSTKNLPRQFGIKLEKGEIATSDVELANKIKVDRSTIKRKLFLMQNDEMLHIKRYNTGTIITICNYEQYQSIDDVDATTNATTSTTTSTTTNATTNATHQNQLTIKPLNQFLESRLELNLAQNLDSSFLPKKLAEIWNSKKSANQPAVKIDSIKSGSPRYRAATARIKDEPDPAYWESVVLKIAASPFCNGANDRGWKANFDFLVKPETHHKATEGIYDDKIALLSKQKFLSLEDIK